MPAVPQDFADFLLLQLVGGLAGAPGELDIMGDERVPRIARQKDDLRSAPLGRRNKIFAAQFIPAVGLGALFEAIVRIDDPGNPRIVELLRLERKGVAVALAKIGAE